VVSPAWAVPAGVWIGRSPRLARALQPVIQVVASFPAPMLFPLVILLFERIGVGLGLGAVALMVLAGQWYILFNVISAVAAIPEQLKDAATVFRLPRLARWRALYLPAAFPALVTGWVTAAGGAWNGSIVAEYIEAGGRLRTTQGLGSLISEATAHANFPLLAGGIALMSLIVVGWNRRVRQEHPAAAVRRPGAPRGRGGAVPRAAAGGSARRGGDGVPVVRAPPLAHRGRERGDGAGGAGRGWARPARRRGPRYQPGRPRRFRAGVPQGALGGDEATGRVRARPRRRPRDHADGRAVRRARSAHRGKPAQPGRRPVARPRHRREHARRGHAQRRGSRVPRGPHRRVRLQSGARARGARERAAVSPAGAESRVRGHGGPAARDPHGHAAPRAGAGGTAASYPV